MAAQYIINYNWSHVRLFRVSTLYSLMYLEDWPSISYCFLLQRRNNNNKNAYLFAFMMSFLKPSSSHQVVALIVLVPGYSRLLLVFMFPLVLALLCGSLCLSVCLSHKDFVFFLEFCYTLFYISIWLFRVCYFVDCSAKSLSFLPEINFSYSS